MANGKCSDIFLALQSCNFAVIICLICWFPPVSARSKPNLALDVECGLLREACMGVVVTFARAK